MGVLIDLLRLHMTAPTHFKQSVVFQALAVFLLPVIESIFVRFAWHEILGPNTLVLGFHQTDVLPGIALGVGVLFWLYHKTATFELSFQKTGVLFHAAVVALFTLHMSFFDTFTVSSSPRLSAFLLLTFFAVTLFSSLFVWVPVAQWKVRYEANHRPTLAVLMGILCLTSYPFIIEYYWKHLATWVGVCVTWALNLMGLDVKYHMGQTLFLQHKVLTARLMKPCSGLEGIFLFLFAFTLTWGFDQGRLSLKRRMAAYAAGVLFMFSLNVARIVAFFAFSVTMSRSGLGRGPEQQLRALFHSGVGVTFYLIGITLFLWAVYRFRPRPVAAVVGDRA